MTDRSLVRDRTGGSNGVQTLILIAALGLAGVTAVKALSSAIGGRGDCAAEQIVAFSARAGCAEADGDGQPTANRPPEAPPAPEANDEEKEILDELLALAADLIGLTDAKKCITEGDLLACFMTALNFTPGKIFGLGFKLISKSKKIFNLIDRLLGARKAKKAAEEAAEQAGTKGDDLVAGAGKCKNGKCDQPGVCFAPGTPVHTDVGLVPIEKLRPGDRVWSRDDKTGEEGYRPVVQTFVTPDQPLLALALEDATGASEVLEVTAPHPFWVEGRGWVVAGDLRPGDQVAGAEGGLLRVAASRATARRTTVYNFEVEEFHTYFVGASAAWVHNDCKSETLQVKGEPDPKRVDELGVNHEQGNRIDLAEGQGGARYEIATGRKLERSTTEGADFIDPEVGPISLKGPLVNKSTGAQLPVNQGMVDGLAKSVVKDVKFNTATRQVVVDTKGMTPAQRQSLKDQIAAELGTNPGKDIVFLE